MHKSLRWTVVEDDFILAIQTKVQKVRYEGNASKIVCADSTHNTTQYGFKLTNVIVPDEFHKGYPVAHLISNKENTETLTLFFDAMKNKCNPDISITALMTDDDSAAWNAFSNAFGTDIQHFLCQWHYLRAWRTKLRELLPQNSDLRSEIYHDFLMTISPVYF